MSIGDTNVTMQSGEVSYVIGGSKANNSDNTTLKTGSTNIIISGGSISEGVIGGSYIKATGNQSAGTPAATTVATGDTKVVISGGTIKGTIYGGSVADNYGTQQQGGKPDLQATDANTNVTITGGTITGDIYAGGAAIGANSKSTVNGKASVDISGVTITGDVYAGGLAAKGGSASVGESEIKITDATINGAILGYGNTDGQSGSTSVISGNAQIKLAKAVVNGHICLNDSSQSLVASDTAINYAASANDNKAVHIKNGTAVFDGKTTTIKADSSLKDKVYGLYLEGTGHVEFKAADTVIDVRGIGDPDNHWGYGVDIRDSAKAEFTGNNVTIKDYQKDYTAQTFTVRDSANGRSTAVFNNTGDVTISADSQFGATAIVVKAADKNNSSTLGGALTFNNAGNVNIQAAIKTDSNYADTNVVGLMVENGKTVVTDKVKEMKITAKGQGVDFKGTSASDGTAGIFVQNVTGSAAGSSLTIDAAKLTIDVDASVTGDKPQNDKRYETASGIRAYAGTTVVGAGTDSVVTVKGDEKAYGVWAHFKKEDETGTTDANISLLGNTTITAITATGKTGSYALYAEDGGKITVGSAGKTVNITGDIVAENGGNIGLKGVVSSKGQLVVEGGTITNTFTSSGSQFAISNDVYGSNAIHINNTSSTTADNNLSFNADNTEIIAKASGTKKGIYIGNSGSNGNTNLGFNGESLLINVISFENEAHGLSMDQFNYSGISQTDLKFNSKTTTIKVSGKGGNNLSRQVAGVWEACGGYTVGTKTTVTFSGKTEIDVQSYDSEAYGVYVNDQESNKGSTNISFLGDTTIKAMNGNKAGTAVYVSGSNRSVTVGSAGKTVSLTGDVVAENSGVVTLAGDTNTVKGIVKADGGSVVLNGGDKATYDANKFVTANSGKITVSGGTLNIDELKDDTDKKKFDLAGNSLEVTGKGVLKAKSENVFGKDADNKTIVSGTVDEKVLFNGGKLAISDESYSLADSKDYSEALGKVNEQGLATGTTTLVMTGTLKQDDIPNNTATVEALAPTGAVHTQVTGTVGDDSSTNKHITILNIGSDNNTSGPDNDEVAKTVTNDLGIKDLRFGDDSTSVEKAAVNINDGKELTLVGDGSGDLLKGTNSSGNKVTVGGTDSSGKSSAGTLTLGNTAAANSGGTLNAEVKVQADSQMKVEAGSFKVDKITATAGTVAVNEGAVLKTADLTIGNTDASTAGAVHAAGTVEVDKLTVNKGTVAVTGTLAATTKFEASSDASIAVGDSTSAGTLTATGVQLQGASIVLDPIWKGNDKITTASKAGLEFANSHQIDGKLTVGQNSVLSLGTTDTSKAEAAFAATGLNWGQNDITAALYIDTAQTLGSETGKEGGIKVDGTLTHDSETKDLAVANNAVFAANSLLMVTSAAATTNDGALKATNSGKLIVDAGAKLYIADAQAYKTYTVVSGFSGTTDSDVKGWAGDNLLLNKLVKATESKFDSGSYTVKTEKVKASEALPGVALPNILDAMTIDSNSEYAGVKYLSEAIKGLNTDAQTIASVNAFAQGAENSGASHGSVLAAFDTGSIVQEHLSLASKGNEQRGGFGKAAADRENNGGIWAQYLHNKDKSDAGYEGQYNGFVLGGDFADKGKYSSGVAFSYGSGDSTGSASKNEYDFWGLSYYGGIRNDDTNLIFDVGYSKNSSEIKGVVNADPDTRIITLGVKGEKMYTNGHGTKFVPYAGLRYMNVDTDSYTGTIDGKTAAHYSPDKANLWLLPVGVSITNETVSESGWKVRPTADIAYVWTMGDNDNAMGITVPGINAQDRLGYELMDSGFFVGRLGLEAEKDDWTYGVSYSYQKGSDAQSNKWFVDVKYSF
ncbi:autotransporter domain-containing protein [Phascolarctobacterium sp.]